jgi:hypothetical protein
MALTRRADIGYSAMLCCKFFVRRELLDDGEKMWRDVPQNIHVNENG